MLNGAPFPDVSLIRKARKYVHRSNLPQPRRFFSYNLLFTLSPREIFTDDFLCSISSETPLTLAAEYYREAGSTAMLNRLLNIDLKITITDNDLRKVTRMCELADVSVRYPMLDRTLAEFSGSIPARLKVKGFQSATSLRKPSRASCRLRS